MTYDEAKKESDMLEDATNELHDNMMKLGRKIKSQEPHNESVALRVYMAAVLAAAVFARGWDSMTEEEFVEDARIAFGLAKNVLRVKRPETDSTQPMSAKN
jgi:hypothetical protein